MASDHSRKSGRRMGIWILGAAALLMLAIGLPLASAATRGAENLDHWMSRNLLEPRRSSRRPSLQMLFQRHKDDKDGGKCRTLEEREQIEFYVLHEPYSAGTKQHLIEDENRRSPVDGSSSSPTAGWDDEVSSDAAGYAGSNSWCFQCTNGLVILHCQTANLGPHACNETTLWINDRLKYCGHGQVAEVSVKQMTIDLAVHRENSTATQPDASREEHVEDLILHCVSTCMASPEYIRRIFRRPRYRPKPAQTFRPPRSHAAAENQQKSTKGAQEVAEMTTTAASAAEDTENRTSTVPGTTTVISEEGNENVTSSTESLPADAAEDPGENTTFATETAGTDVMTTEDGSEKFATDKSFTVMTMPTEFTATAEGSSGRETTSAATLTTSAEGDMSTLQESSTPSEAVDGRTGTGRKLASGSIASTSDDGDSTDPSTSGPNEGTSGNDQRIGDEMESSTSSTTVTGLPTTNALLIGSSAPQNDQDSSTPSPSQGRAGQLNNEEQSDGTEAGTSEVPSTIGFTAETINSHPSTPSTTGISVIRDAQATDSDVISSTPGDLSSTIATSEAASEGTTSTLGIAATSTFGQWQDENVSSLPTTTQSEEKNTLAVTGIPTEASTLLGGGSTEPSVSTQPHAVTDADSATTTKIPSLSKQGPERREQPEETITINHPTPTRPAAETTTPAADATASETPYPEHQGSTEDPAAASTVTTPETEDPGELAASSATTEGFSPPAAETTTALNSGRASIIKIPGASTSRIPEGSPDVTESSAGRATTTGSTGESSSDEAETTTLRQPSNVTSDDTSSVTHSPPSSAARITDSSQLSSEDDDVDVDDSQVIPTTAEPAVTSARPAGVENVPQVSSSEERDDDGDDEAEERRRTGTSRPTTSESAAGQSTDAGVTDYEGFPGTTTRVTATAAAAGDEVSTTDAATTSASADETTVPGNGTTASQPRTTPKALVVSSRAPPPSRCGNVVRIHGATIYPFIVSFPGVNGAMCLGTLVRRGRAISSFNCLKSETQHNTAVIPANFFIHAGKVSLRSVALTAKGVRSNSEKQLIAIDLNVKKPTGSEETHMPICVPSAPIVIRPGETAYKVIGWNGVGALGAIDIVVGMRRSFRSIGRRDENRGFAFVLSRNDCYFILEGAPVVQLGEDPDASMTIIGVTTDSFQGCMTEKATRIVIHFEPYLRSEVRRFNAIRSVPASKAVGSYHRVSSRRTRPRWFP